MASGEEQIPSAAGQSHRARLDTSPRVTLPSSWKDAKKLTVHELKKICGQLGVAVAGRKGDLLARVCSCLEISTCGQADSADDVDFRWKPSPFDADTKQKYDALGKLSDMGGSWTSDLSSVPPSFSLDKIKAYLIDSPEKTFDQQSVRAYKSLRAWSLSQEGHILMMSINPNLENKEFLVVRGYCIPSQATGKNAYPVHVCLGKVTGSVYGAECRCVAGMGECCSHVAALLFRLDDLLSHGETKIPEDLACTDTPCSWIVPANAAKVHPVTMDEVQIYKPEFGKPKPQEPQLSLANFHPVPLTDVRATPQSAGELAAKLRQACPTQCPFVTMFDGQQYMHFDTATNTDTAEAKVTRLPPPQIAFFDMAPSREETVRTVEERKDSVSPQQASVNGFLHLRCLVNTTLAPSVAEEDFLSSFASAVYGQRSKIEQDTRGQVINSNWHFYRAGRITSSRSHKIGHLREKTNVAPVLSTVLSCTDRDTDNPKPLLPISAAPLTHGYKLEPIARREYIQHMKTKGTPVSVALCGLFVSDHIPWLASSPDALVRDDHCAEKFGVLEIKCPFSTEPVSSLMSKPSFCLHEKDGMPSLRPSHEYYTQVQHHMAVVDRPWCDFVVYTANSQACSSSLEIVRVRRNEEFWFHHFLKLEKFYVEFVVPEIVRASKQRELAETLMDE